MCIIIVGHIQLWMNKIEHKYQLEYCKIRYNLIIMTNIDFMRKEQNKTKWHNFYKGLEKYISIFSIPMKFSPYMCLSLCSIYIPSCWELFSFFTIAWLCSLLSPLFSPQIPLILYNCLCLVLIRIHLQRYQLLVAIKIMILSTTLVQLQK